MIESKLRTLNLTLPAPLQLPAGVRLPFKAIHVVGPRILISGHGPLDATGKLAGPFGKVGREVSAEAACHAAQLTMLAILSDLKTALGSLDRVAGWVRLFGMVNSAPGFTECPAVINGASDLVVALWGEERGAHARSAIGVAELPWNIPVEIEVEAYLA